MKFGDNILAPLSAKMERKLDKGGLSGLLIVNDELRIVNDELSHPQLIVHNSRFTINLPLRDSAGLSPDFPHIEATQARPHRFLKVSLKQRLFPFETVARLKGALKTYAVLNSGQTITRGR